MYYLICAISIFCSTLPIQAQLEEDIYYYKAIVDFNSTDEFFQIVVVSLNQNLGIFGSHSPKKNISGTIVTPIIDMYGCEEAEYENNDKHSSWIALVARGKCTFFTKINQAAAFNASAIIIYDREFETRPVVMNTEGADGIVSVSILFEIGDAVRSALNQNKNVKGSITVGGRYPIHNRNPLQIERTSILFVSVAFMILMIVSLAWLVFYYIQKFRLVRSQHRGEQRQRELYTRALALMKTRHLKNSDPLLTTESVCAICIEHYKASDLVRSLPCKHEFHKWCVDPWLESKHTCPMCKINVMKTLGVTGHDNPAVDVNEDDQRNVGASSHPENTSSPYTDQGEQASPYTDNPNISSSANPTRTHFMQHALQSNEDQKHFDSNFA